ncbi:MAG: zinc dependent phospholipase C family protein [Acidobacteria bacterium]|nr:zinc dependent phospholipase C family protein [Acidobacteriota bacterium]
MRRGLSRTALTCLLACALVVITSSRHVAAYSVLAHEAAVDALWTDTIAPLLKQRFPQISPEDLLKARAYAYGGAVIQDLGYFPFGSPLFTNLVHYVRSGAFVEALLRDARDVNELAFAIGALAHYASDNSGHPHAVNRVIPLMYPKIQARYGDEVLYVNAKAQHVMVEFAFDVSQVAQGAYVATAYHDFIGFEVAERVLNQAFLETYGLEAKDLFLDQDLAIGTYRRAVGKTIPQLTELAWREKQDEILERNPKIERSAFVYALSPRDYDQTFGTKYRKPGFFARFLIFVAKVVPKIGPFRPLAFEPLTADAEQLFLESLKASRDAYRQSLVALRAGRLNLRDTDFDTGELSGRSENPLADETYAELLGKLSDSNFAGVSTELRAELNRYYAAPRSAQTMDRKRRKQHEEALRHLTALNSGPGATACAQCAEQLKRGPETEQASKR